MFVFVIMPFEITEIYEDIIKPTLDEEGCKVVRGDTHDIPRNIVKDIMHYLDQADLVIADLTGFNANVFYELGIAHALFKPTFMITQDDVNKLPFDLKSYRTYRYSFNHKDVNQLKARLRQIVQAFKDGKLTPESPVTDFLPKAKPPLAALAATKEPGQLMHEAEEAYSKKDFQLALNLAEAGLEKWPKRGRLRGIAGRAAVRLKLADTAVKHGELISQQEPGNWQGYEIQADGYMEMGEWTLAIPLLRKAIKLTTQEFKGFLYSRLGNSYEKIGELELAIRAYDESVNYADNHISRSSSQESASRLRNTFAAVRADNSVKFVILEAKWGSDKGVAQGWEDVTYILRSKIIDDALDLVVSIGNLGDPNPGVPKQLRIKYFYNDVVYQKEVNEDESLVIPES